MRLTAGLLTFTIDGVEDEVLPAGTQITLLPDFDELEGGRIRKIQVGAQNLWVTAEDLEASTGAGIPAAPAACLSAHC